MRTYEATEQAYKSGYDKGKADALKWIPVTERLPGVMDWVLCACVDGEIRILCYDYIMDDWDIHNRPNSCYRKGFVTHWMPLPEPPKEDDHG